MTLARWQKRRPQTLLPPMETLIQQYINHPLYENSRKQFRGSCNPHKCETSHTEVSRIICGAVSPESLSLAQCYMIERKLPAPSFFLGMKRLDHISNVVTSFGGMGRLPEELASVLPISEHR